MLFSLRNLFDYAIQLGAQEVAVKYLMALPRDAGRPYSTIKYN